MMKMFMAALATSSAAVALVGAAGGKDKRLADKWYGL